jgi:DNA-binding response OmpR family regulator
MRIIQQNITVRTAAGAGTAPPLSIGHLDNDSGFLLVTTKRMGQLDWEHQVLGATVTPEQVATLPLDALVVNLAILGRRCWDWLERLCGQEASFGIVVCTSSASVAERVRALRVGADDWLSKPCHPEELIARVEAVVRLRRRSEYERDVKPIAAGELEIRRDLYRASAGGHDLNLTRREYQLLELLASNEGNILERKCIYESLWGYDMVRGDRSVDVFVRKLRQKLDLASPCWNYIHTHFGVGYSFAAKPIDSRAAPSERLAA